MILVGWGSLFVTRMALFYASHGPRNMRAESMPTALSRNTSQAKNTRIGRCVRLFVQLQGKMEVGGLVVQW